MALLLFPTGVAYANRSVMASARNRVLFVKVEPRQHGLPLNRSKLLGVDVLREGPAVGIQDLSKHVGAGTTA